MNIIASILTFLIILAINLGTTIFAYGFMIVAMNGFPTSDSVQPGITLFNIWVIVSIILMSVLSVSTVLLLSKKIKLNPFLAGLISTILFSVVSVISLVVGTFAALALVSFLWEMR